MGNIDFVVTWVDGADPLWREEKDRYAGVVEGDNRDVRFRDWELLRYWFRGVEQNAPWVNKIHFVTWGHIPDWLNVQNEKLRIVNHRDYIPEECLPTFNSHTIEFFLHRIEGLSETFVYFNDDVFVIKPVKEADFFLRGLPRDAALLAPCISSHRGSIMDIVLSDVEIINDHFDKNRVIKSNLHKWFTPLYGYDVLRNFCLMPWKRFACFAGSHTSQPYLKSTFEEVWEKEYETLYRTCLHKFRMARDVNHWLMRFWQIASGRFIPRRLKGYGSYYALGNDNEFIVKAVKGRATKLICVNDNDADEVRDFNRQKEIIHNAFEEVLPNKSSFER